VPNKIKNTITADSAKAPVSPLTLQSKDSLQDTPLSTPLFEKHLLIVKNPEPQLHTTHYDYWITGILMVMYMSFVWIYVSNRKKLNQIIKSFYSGRSSQSARDEFSIGNRVAVFLSLFFIVTLTVFISHVLPYNGFKLYADNMGSMGILTAFLIITIYAIKFLSIRLLGHIFKVQKEAQEYSLLVFLFCNVLGLFMLPLVVCLTFLKQVPPQIFIYSGFAIILILMGIRTLRALILGLSHFRISKLYLFMYLCTLEILPFIILAKLFMLKVK
jgi:hypothetical protein